MKLSTRPKWLEGVDLKKLRKHVDEDGGDGWSIWKPEYFTKMGFKADDLPTEKHESGEGKHAITNSETGQIADVTGVWNLTFMTVLAGHLGVKYAGYMGRGFQARAIRDVVLPALDSIISTEKKKGTNEKQR
jgi:hypothetical protein